jgi:hypothetical protein
VDTRLSDGPALAGGTTRVFTITGKCGIPVGAKAVAFNLTVTGPTAPGDLRLYAGGPLPLVSTINFRAGQTRANNAVSGLSDDGEAALRCDLPGGQSVHAILDVTGYFD